ncbi:MAG: cytochrome ubiquinol oxidase subunit I, partial [Muribaculaceae bacterium]|nr:cytochrome ubiquinol oxidase subunit I [Muribaculaceae bacterium]
ICSQAGWIVAEVGRQPWVIQDLMPTRAAISDVTTGSVQLTFWIFAVLFTMLLAAEISMMLRYIYKASKNNIEQPE